MEIKFKKSFFSKISACYKAVFNFFIKICYWLKEFFTAHRSILITILTIVLLTGFSISLFFWYQVEVPLSHNNNEQIFYIEPGQGVNEIGANLKKANLIRNDWVFSTYVWLNKKTKNLQAGKYKLSPSMNIAQIVEKFIKGEVVKDWIKVTIPEGWTNQQIKKRLLGLGLINETDEIPLDLQGYLFPDTYYFEQNTSIEEIIKKMRENFNQKITDDLKKEIKNQNRSLYEVLIMASILEKEVKSDDDRRIVSGIFWKRLENNYPLESCATIAYILGTDKWRYSYEDTRIKSPYNTYINPGLPPTPINNPGLSAIKAAIYPEYTDYNFFLTDPETGKTIFSRTLEEHNINKRKYFNL